MEHSFNIYSLLAKHGRQAAIINPSGDVCSYEKLLENVAGLAFRLLDGSGQLGGRRIGLYAEPGPGFAAGLLAVWAAGGIAVPLGLSHPLPVLEQSLAATGVDTVLAGETVADRLMPLAKQRRFNVLLLEQSMGLPWLGALPGVPADSPALILFTSGTAGKPKGCWSRTKASRRR